MVEETKKHRPVRKVKAVIRGGAKRGRRVKNDFRLLVRAMWWMVLRKDKFYFGGVEFQVPE
jgi:hypothetical protein